MTPFFNPWDSYNASIMDVDDSESQVSTNASDYDYKLEDSFTTYDMPDLISTSVIYGTTMIVGLLGNTLIIYTVIRYRRMRTISNVFLASLASADLLLILVCVPVKFAQFFSYSWTLGEFCCKFVHYVQNVSAISSVLTLTSMSVERYYAIIHPVKSRYLCTMSQARSVIITIWLLSLLTAVPIIFVQVLMKVGEKHPAFWCVRNWDDPPLWRAYELYMILLVLILPCSVMTFAYSRICHQLWIVVKERAGMMSGESTELTFQSREAHPKNHFATSGGSANPPNISNRPKSVFMKVDDDSATVKQVIKMLVAVVVLFVVCWAPILINNVMTAFGYLDKLNSGYLKPLRTTLNLMSYFNSCVNPCVYGFMSKNFRNSFKAALATCLHVGGRSDRLLAAGHPSLSRTRTTSISYGRSTYVS